MNTISNNNKLSEEQKAINKLEAQSKLIQIVLEYIYKGGNNNASIKV